MAAIVTQHRHISRDVLMEHVNVLYPMLKAELFLRWDRDELPDVIDALANEMQRQGLITLQDDELHINPAHSRTLQLLAAGARETLQRYAITFWLLSANPSINRGTLEKESRTVAQRLSVLHGINAPEFFDKAVFSSLVLTLRDEGYISDSGDAEPAETMKVEMQRQGLITLQDDELHINPAHSRTLQLLAAGARETLQRYAITFWLLSANPSINRGTLEKESRTVAQRLSVLHGINAPEFFDKAVFSSLVLTLRDEGYISDSGDAEPAETMKVYQLLAELITSDVRLTIESATQGEG